MDVSALGPVIIVLAVFIGLIGLSLFFHFVPVRLWIEALAAQAPGGTPYGPGNAGGLGLAPQA